MRLKEWRPVPGWDAYEVSRCGSVRRIGKSKSLAQHKDGRGYRKVTLSQAPRLTTAKVHRLVCETFHGPAPEGQPQVNHKNGIKNSNYAENLEWVSNAENQAHASKNFLYAYGETNPQATISDDEVREMRELRKQGWMPKALGAKFGCNQSTVSKICLGRRRRSS